MLAQFVFLFSTVLLPIFLLIGLGALVQKFHPIDIGTLAKLQIYLFVPAFMFIRVADSSLSWGQIGGIAGTIFLIKIALGVPLYFTLTKLRLDRGKVSTILLASVVFNAGNFGIPVAERAFGPAGGAVEALIVMIANLSLWGIGYALTAALSGGGVSGLVAYFKLPMVYLMALAFLLKATGIKLPEPIHYSAQSVADGLVPLALITLGAQLASQKTRPVWRRLAPVVVLKLIAMPAVAALIVWALGLWPWPGAQIIVAAAGPTAVNTILLAMEQKGDVELAAECVFWTTVFSAISVTVILAIVMAYGGTPTGR